MARPDTDICVIGAGSGGLVLAAGAAQLGARVTLIEGAEMGGDCLNYGCVPSKALLAAAQIAQTTRSGGLGVAGAEPRVDFAAVMAHVQASIAEIAQHDSQERFESLGVRVIRGWARFAGPDRVEVAGQTITARRIVIATGARAVVPDLPGLDRVPHYTNETLFSLTERPRHLVILGGGPVAVEMAQGFQRLGSAVTLIARSRVMGQDDPEAVELVMARMRAEGVIIRERRTATAVAPSPGGFQLTLSDGTVLEGSHLLLAMGRKPALSGLSFATGGVEATDAGIKVDASLRSVSNRRVYAIGDAVGGAQFTHVASYHAGLVLRQAVLGLPAKAKAVVPRITYCDPELAQLGPTEAMARATYGAALTVQRVGFDHIDRAITDHATDGFIKLMIVKGRPVGVTLVGSDVADQMTLWSLALSARVKLSAVAGMIAPYPTLGEIAKRAAGAYFSRRLFDSAMIKNVVRFLQRVLP